MQKYFALLWQIFTSDNNYNLVMLYVKIGDENLYLTSKFRNRNSSINIVLVSTTDLEYRTTSCTSPWFHGHGSIFSLEKAASTKTRRMQAKKLTRSVM